MKTNYYDNHNHIKQYLFNLAYNNLGMDPFTFPIYLCTILLKCRHSYLIINYGIISK